jgi:hypothetical protein
MAEVIFVVAKDVDVQGLEKLEAATGVTPLSVDPDDPTYGQGTMVIGDEPTSGQIVLVSPNSDARLDEGVLGDEPVDVIVVEPTRVLNAETLTGIVRQAVRTDTVVRFHVMEREP